MSKPTPNATKPTRSARLSWVALDEIQINPRAQREFRQAWAESILSTFDLDKFQVPTVNKRDGSHYMVDGQHGTWAYKQWLGDTSGQKIQVWLHEGLSEAEEAELFLALNNKKQVDAFAKFRAAVTAGRPDECDIDRIVRANHCHVSREKIPGAIRSVTALQFVYRGQGPRILGEVIRTIATAYGDEGFEAEIVKGLGLVLGRYPDIDMKHLITKMRSAQGGSKGLINRANALRLSTGQQKSQCVAGAIVEVYNRGKRGRAALPSWWKDVA